MSIHKILLVDDDHGFLELAERLLIKEGYSPISTDAPESVLQIARTVKPAAIFVDIMMPGLNGWDVVEMLKSDASVAKIPVIMMSAIDDQTRSGAPMTMIKPLDSQKLRAVLKAAKDGADRRNDDRDNYLTAIAV